MYPKGGANKKEDFDKISKLNFRMYSMMKKHFNVGHNMIFQNLDSKNHNRTNHKSLNCICL